MCIILKHCWAETVFNLYGKVWHEQTL